MKFKHLITLLVMFPLFLCAQKGTTIKGGKTFKVTFLLDTIQPLDLPLQFTYYGDSDLVIITDTPNVIARISGIGMEQEYRDAIDNYLVNKKNASKPISNKCSFEIYYYIVSKIYKWPDTDPAGSLHLNRAIKVVTDINPPNRATRILGRDSLQILLTINKLKADKAITELDKSKNSLLQKYELTYNGDTSNIWGRVADTNTLNSLTIEARKIPQPDRTKVNSDSIHSIIKLLLAKIPNSQGLPYNYFRTIFDVASKNLISDEFGNIDWRFDRNRLPISVNDLTNHLSILPYLDTASFQTYLKSIAAYNAFVSDTLNKYTISIGHNTVIISNMLSDTSQIANLLNLTITPQDSNTNKYMKRLKELAEGGITAAKHLNKYIIFQNGDALTDLSKITNNNYRLLLPDTTGANGFTYEDSVRSQILIAFSNLDSVNGNKVRPTVQQFELASYIYQLGMLYNAKNSSGSPMFIRLDNMTTDLEIDKFIFEEKAKPVTKTVINTPKIIADIKRQMITVDSLSNIVSSIVAKMKTQGYSIIDSVQFQFEHGFLENVKVKIDGETYENIYAIGFSSKENYRALSNIWLWVRETDNKTGTAKHICLGDVFDYDNDLDLGTRDYCPGDTVIKVHPADNSRIVVYKEKLKDLFETKVFTDLDGIGANNPNGLVQIQIGRNVNLLTNRYRMGKRQDYGMLNYIRIEINASKIENKERRLVLSNERIVNANEIISPSYATNLDYRRYENFSIVIEPNVFTLDFPDAKTTLRADLGFRYGYVPVTDSILRIDSATQTIIAPVNANNFDAHTLSVYPRIWFEFLSERRYNFTIGYQFISSTLFSNNLFKQVVSYSGKAKDLQTNPIDHAARYSHVIELGGKFEPSKKDRNGKIFVSAKFFMQHHDSNTFFPQIQIGYAYDLILKK